MNKKLLSALMSVVMLAGSCSAVGAVPQKKSTKNSIVNFVKNHKLAVGGVTAGAIATGVVLYLANNHKEIKLDCSKISPDDVGKLLKDSVGQLSNSGDRLVVSNVSWRNLKPYLKHLKQSVDIDATNGCSVVIDAFVNSVEKSKDVNTDKILGELVLIRNKNNKFNLKYEPLFVYDRFSKIFQNLKKLNTLEEANEFCDIVQNTYKKFSLLIGPERCNMYINVLNCICNEYGQTKGVEVLKLVQNSNESCGESIFESGDFSGRKESKEDCDDSVMVIGNNANDSVEPTNDNENY